MAEEAPGKKQKLSEAEEKALAGLDPSIRVSLNLHTNRATSVMDDKLQNFKDNFVAPRMEKIAIILPPFDDSQFGKTNKL